MQVYPYQVFVCEQVKPEGVPCCCARGSAAVMEGLRAQVERQGLADRVQITSCGSIGLCERGPNMVVYPEGIWYSGVQPTDVAEIVESHFRNGQPLQRLVNTDAGALRTEITLNRSRYQNSMREKDASGALPDPLLQTIRSFQESRAILSAIELDLFEAVGSGAPAERVADKAGTDPRATEMLLNAMVACGLLKKRDGTYENTPVSTRYLTAGGKDDNRAALMHIAHLWHTWTGLTETVRTGVPPSQRQMPDRGADWTEAFIAAMHRNATERAGAIVQAITVEGVRRVLDVGGGSGAYSIAMARVKPDLSAEIFDLATVTPIAERHIRAAGVADRVSTRVGDLRKDRLGQGYDLILVSAICHMLSRDENRDLLKRCAEALTPGGRVVVQDFILEADKTAPKSGALFALNMLVGTAAGSSYSEPEYLEWMGTAGLANVHRVRLPGPTGLVIGTKS